MYGYSSIVLYSLRFFKVGCIFLDTFTDLCDQGTCKLMNHCGITNGSCSVQNSLQEFFSFVHVECTHHLFHLTPCMLI